MKYLFGRKMGFFRRKDSYEQIMKDLEKILGYTPRIHYCTKSKYWWVQVEGDKYFNPFPKGVWYRVDHFYV